MLPGKKYQLEDLIRILWRRVWFLLIPFAVVSAGAAAVAQILPDRYRATALVAVVPQQIPESIVRPTVTTRLTDRLQAIENQVLSRPRLEKLITDLNLYAEERRTGIMDDIVQRMRSRDLRITPQGAVAFRVVYDGPEPESTKRVVDQVASDFITESLSDRSRLADRTNQFLDSEVEDARRRLTEREAALAAYKKAHGHELPTQTQANLQAMIAANAQAQAIVQARSTATERRLQLDRQFALEREGPTTGDPVIDPAVTRRGAPPAGPATQALITARKQLDTATVRWTPAHPDVQRLSSLVKDLEVKAQAELLASTGTGRGAPGVSPAELVHMAKIEELEKTIAEIDAQIERHDADEKLLRAQATEYRARIEAAPTRENELTELMRGYGAIETQFNDLNRKSELVRLNANLERQEIGQQFRLIEAAVVPGRPFSPDRRAISLLGMVAGLGLGLGFIALLEYRDGGFKTDHEVTAVLGLPVLAVVPVMRSDQERRRAVTWRLVVGLGLGSTVAVCLALVAYTLVR